MRVKLVKKKKLYGFMPIITGICFGSAGIFVRKLSGNMNNTTIVASRLIVAVLLLGIWLAYSHPEYFKIHLKDCWIFIGAGLLGSLGVNVCYNFAINELSLSLAAVLLALSPIVVMIVAFFLFHEAITRRKVLSIFLAICGCVLTSGIFETNESMHWSWIGILVGSVGAIFYAMYSIFSKVGMRRGYPALTITFYSILSIAVILLPFAKWGDVAAVYYAKSVNAFRVYVGAFFMCCGGAICILHSGTGPYGCR